MYITTHISTVFPLVATRPANFRFTSHRTENAKLVRVSLAESIRRPLYATENEVTSAIADGSFKGFAPTAYAEAKAYQLILKAAKKN